MAPHDRAFVIRVDDPAADDVRGLLERHLDAARDASPPEHVHALQVVGLLDPAVTFVSARRADGLLLGVGALKRLTNDQAELKSMHTAAEARRQGIGRAILGHLLALASERGFTAVSLETGTMESFGAARAMYAAAGFAECEPFGTYTPNDYSVCMTLSLGARGTGD